MQIKDVLPRDAIASIDSPTFGPEYIGSETDDNLVLYDRQTESEWKQSTGYCIAGELQGSSLAVISAPMISYEAFREAHPEGQVLQPPADDSPTRGREYDSSPYDAYAEGDGFGLGPMRGSGPSQAWDREDLNPKTVVIGIQHDGEAVGFPLSEIEQADGVIESTVGEQRVIVVATDDGMHAFEHPGFSLDIDVTGRLTGDGAVWGAAIGSSDDCRQLTRIRSRRLFAFARQVDILLRLKALPEISSGLHHV